MPATTVIADVSEFQLDIDWAAYGAANPAVIVRVHNGWRADNYWAQNVAGARKSCQWRGFYQYLPASADPVAAARAFQATTGPLLPGEVAILDLEEGAGDQRARRQAWLTTLQDPVEWVYSGLFFARAHLPGVGVEWLAAYGQAEMVDAHTLWQFTNAQRFAGISSPCDASVFNGTLAALQARTGAPAQPVTPVVVHPTPPAGGLTVDGVLGSKTIARWQQVLGVGVDGVISTPSAMVTRVQSLLNKHGAHLLVDGRGIAQDNRKYLTVAALQRYLGTPVDGVLSLPVSAAVKALQARLNAGRF